MPDTPRVILSGFADEAANQKTAVQQFAAFAALGLQYYSLRFIDVGSGVKNVMQLTIPEIQKIRHLENEYGLNVASLGSPLGKVKLVDVEDGTKNAFIPFKKYLEHDVKKACELAHAFETKLIRGFSFYPPKGADPKEYLSQAVEQLGEIAETCHRADLTFGLEVEANLVGCTGYLLADIYRQVNHPGMELIFDAANILVQGYSTVEAFAQYQAMKPGLGWMHVKDYLQPSIQPLSEGLGVRTDVPSATAGEASAAHTESPKGTKPASKHVEEDKLAHFVPCDRGDGVYERILRDFARIIPAIEKKFHRRGIPGVLLDLEPHLKGGGQYGGFSGPDGMGVALRSLCRALDYVGIEYHLRDFEDIRAARGF
jgi:sugar phosphate isomerase/epimerase